MKQEIIDRVESLSEIIIGYRRDFHNYPELGWLEVRTASIVAKTLESLGFEVILGRGVVDGPSRMGLPSSDEMTKAYKKALEHGAEEPYASEVSNGFTGVVGILNCGQGPEVALRFDMDALPVKEAYDETHFPFQEGFASEALGVMHACGHDGHTAMGLGIAHIISIYKETFSGTIKLIFQPAEEGVRGASAMVEAGVLKGVDYLLGAHLGIKENSGGTLYAGTSGFYATTKSDIALQGVSSHAGASPELGKNALLASAAIALQLHSIPRHSQGMTRINVGRLEAGSGRNIIGDTGFLCVETRGSTSDLNHYMQEELVRRVASISQLYDVDYAIKTVGVAESGSSDDEVSLVIEDLASNMPFFKEVHASLPSFGGSEDFTCMMSAVQSSGGKACYSLIGSNIKAPHHNGYFDFEEEDMLNGVKLLALTVLDLGRL